MITVPILSLLFGALLAYGAIAAATLAWIGYMFGAPRWQVVVFAGFSAACAFSLGVMVGVPVPAINFELR